MVFVKVDMAYLPEALEMIKRESIHAMFSRREDAIGSSMYDVPRCLYGLWKKLVCGLDP
jgi:hypothetical protein